MNLRNEKRCGHFLGENYNFYTFFSTQLLLEAAGKAPAQRDESTTFRQQQLTRYSYEEALLVFFNFRNLCSTIKHFYKYSQVIENEE